MRLGVGGALHDSVASLTGLHTAYAVAAVQKLAGAGVKQLAAQAKRRVPHAPPVW